MAQRALAAHDRGELRVTIGCFSDYFGPGEGADSTLSITMLDPALAGKRMRAIYDLDVPHVFAYLPDMAELFLTLALDSRADGRRWVLPHGAALTQREVQRLVAEAAGVAPRHGVYGPLAMWLAGRFDKDIREVVAIRSQWQQPWEVDGSAFTATFGEHRATPLDGAIAATVAAATAITGPVPAGRP
jgi:nucleoside-diphosphate-sugar epimerase